MKAVLFDFGHTLFEPVDEVARCRPHVGDDVTDDVIRATAAAVRARSRTAAEIAKQRDLGPDVHRACWLDLLAPFDAFAPGLARRLYQDEISAAGWVPYPDTAATLAALAQENIPIGIVSDTGWDIRTVFAAYDLERYVGAWALSYEVGVAKPAPAMFLTACAQLGADPADTVMVGDNELTDGGADAAGLAVLVLPATPPGARRGLDVVLRLIG